MSELQNQQPSTTTVIVEPQEPLTPIDDSPAPEQPTVSMETMDGRETFQMFGSDLGNFSKAAQAAQTHMREHWREWARQNNYSVSFDATPPPKEPPPPPPPPPRDEPDVFLGPRKKNPPSSSGVIELSSNTILSSSKPPPPPSGPPPPSTSLSLPPNLLDNPPTVSRSSSKKKKRFALSTPPSLPDLPFIDSIPSRSTLLQSDVLSIDAFSEEFQQRFSS